LCGAFGDGGRKRLKRAGNNLGIFSEYEVLQ